MAKLKDYDHNKHQRTYRKRHPEKVKRWRVNQYVRFLVLQGWTVTPPENMVRGDVE